MEIRLPLVSVTRTEGDDQHTRLAYYVGDTMIMDAFMLKDIIPSTGPLDEMVLVQILVTPHEHLSVLGDILAYAKAKNTSGPEWDALLARVESLLVPPSA